MSKQLKQDVADVKGITIPKLKAWPPWPQPILSLTFLASTQVAA